MRKILRKLKQSIRKRVPKNLCETFSEMECAIARRWVSSAHRRLMAIQWSLPPQPEFFDHNIDLYYLWLTNRNSLWLERGVFGSLALQERRVLELACGDGFNARHFYSLRSEHIIACDFDPKAIKTAREKNSTSNIEYFLADIRTEMPEGKFENVIWDAAIEHFTPDEIKKIMQDIKSRLTEDGILSGYTIVEKVDNKKSLSQHEYEFKSKEDLLRFLTPKFENVTVFETEYPDRHNLYFWATDGMLPFDQNWPKAVTQRKSNLNGK